ncbi:Ger(x)C family spore germination protein [Cytobacillus firmus]|uniref:Ger(x)C family spore germination protein n=1 Tax=Cytobacillus firmus TaxID=1399 RepID=UPI002186F5E8|nr:Ger(x)C family spore germination protein [Cytobacillus firmus]URM32530.1 Ger(x)C family spore germination protein [Cytobacillus firmus]
MGSRSVLSIFFILFLSGCSLLPTRIVNEVGMIQGVGYDLADEGEIEGTVAYPVFKKEGSTTEVKSASGYSSKEIREKLNNETQLRLVSGQLRLALYGKSLAESGINDFIDTLNRDPFIGSIVQLAIVDGETKELMNLNKYQSENISIYLQEMLDQNMEFGTLPKTNLQTFLFQLFQTGQDAYLPLLKNVNGTIRITGLAVFKDDSFIASIPREDIFMFKTLLKKNKNNGTQAFVLENGDKVVLETLYSNPKYKINMVQGKPEFSIHLKMKTKLQEYSSSEKKRQTFDSKKYQDKVEKELEKKALTFINRLKEEQVDPLGLGAKFREHDRAFDEQQWKMHYPNVKVSIKADVEIEQTGTIN